VDDAQANRGYARTPPAEPEPFWPPDEAEAKARRNGPDGAAQFAPRMPFPTTPVAPTAPTAAAAPPDGSAATAAPPGTDAPPGSAGSPWAQPLTPQQHPAPTRLGPAGPLRPVTLPPPADEAQPTSPSAPGPPVPPPQPAEPLPPSGDWAAAARPPAPPQAGQSLFTVPAWKTAPTEPAPDPLWTHEPTVPTAEEFARRRATRPADPVASMGMRAAVNKSTLGLVKLPPSRREQEYRHDVDMVRRNFGGLRQVTVVNPKGGAGKTVAALVLAMTFGQKRGGYVLAWDNNETQGTLGMRAQQDFHVRTVRDLLRDLDHFAGAQGRVGDLSQYVRAQGEGMFDVLASDESATAGEMLTGAAFSQIRDVVSRFYKLIVVDTGNNVRATNWQAAIDATDQLVVTMSARNDSAETAARMLDHLEQTGRHRLVRQAVTVVSMPPSRRELDVPAVQRHFAARTRTVVLAPYEPLIDSGEPIRYGQLSSGSREAWLKIAAAVAEGL